MERAADEMILRHDMAVVLLPIPVTRDAEHRRAAFYYRPRRP
jgi:hypothetical protein